MPAGPRTAQISRNDAHTRNSNDLPKIRDLENAFPTQYRDTAIGVDGIELTSQE